MLITAGILFSCMTFAQENQSDSWHHYFGTDIYAMPAGIRAVPCYRADRGWLHLEGRYNYEDEKTFSAWFGYNFRGGDKFIFNITPMAGALAGNTTGAAPGVIVDLEFSGFEFYSESEFVFDFNNRKNDFFYTWNNLSYNPSSSWWFGISFQRSVFYDDSDIQPGILIGTGYKWFSMTGYLFNPFMEGTYGIVTLAAEFP